MSKMLNGSWIGLLLALATATHSAEPLKAVPPPAAFGTPPRTTDVCLSLDGKSAAWFDLGASPQRIVVFDLAKGQDRRVFQIPADTKLRSLSWADDDTLIFEASAARRSFDSNQTYEMQRAFSADVPSGKVQMLLTNGAFTEYVTSATLITVHTSKPKTAIMESYDYSEADARMSTGSHFGVQRKDSGWVRMLFEVDTRSGKATRIDTGTQFTEQFVIDRNGAAVARSEWDAKTHSYTVVAKRGSGWTKIYSREDGRHLDLWGLTADGRAAVAVGLDRDNRSKLLALPLDGSPVEVLYEDPAHEVSGVLWDDLDRRVVGVFTDGLDAQRVYTDPQLSKRLQSLATKFAGQQVRIESRSADNTRLVARVSSPDKPALYYLIDYTAHTADIVGDEYPGLADAKLGKVEMINFKARDGMEIPAYLTTPAGYVPGSPSAMVVLPHGGPASRDYLHFDWLAQFIASRGYVVLQPQFRGSKGFGDTFQRAGEHQWGRLMQDDVTDGVKAMVERHVADAARICIVGASYGGYAALAGAAFTPDLYKCAASINGVFDLPMMQAYIEKNGAEQSDQALYWRDNIGSPLDPKVVEASPNRRAGAITASVLLLHSTDDAVVVAEQSEIMARALRAANKPVTLVRLPGEDHWLSTSKMRVETLAQLDSFLRVNLPPH